MPLIVSLLNQILPNMAKYLFILLSTLLLYSCGSLQKTKKKQSYMSAMYEEIKNEIPEAQVSISQDSLKVLFPDYMLFDFDSYLIKSESYEILQRLGKVLQKYNKTGVLINGYTDNKGAAEYNKTLSQKRANAAEEVLLKLNIAAVRLYSWGHGAINPIADNNTEVGRAKNRRVEFIILYKYNPNK